MHNSVPMGRLSGDIPPTPSDRSPPMARKKPPADAPPPDDNGKPEEEPEEEEWRRPSIHRADQRNVVTYVDKVFGAWIKSIRDANGWCGVTAPCGSSGRAAGWIGSCCRRWCATPSTGRPMAGRRDRYSSRRPVRRCGRSRRRGS